MYSENNYELIYITEFSYYLKSLITQLDPYTAPLKICKRQKQEHLTLYILSCGTVNFLSKSILLLHLEIYVIIVLELATTWTEAFYKKIKNGNSFLIRMLVSLTFVVEI